MSFNDINDLDNLNVFLYQASSIKYPGSNVVNDRNEFSYPVSSIIVVNDINGSCISVLWKHLPYFLHNFIHLLLRRGGAGCDAHTLHAFEPCPLQFSG